MRPPPTTVRPAALTLDPALQHALAHRVLPVVVLHDEADARPLGDALRSGGLPVAEVTLRTPAALDALRALAGDDALVVGAGTVTTAAQVDAAVDAGARFLVSPGFSAAVCARAAQHGVSVVPGVATATELMAALDRGFRLVKLFPAEAVGGVAALRALAAPFPDARFVPTGGIGPDNAAAYLAVPAVLAVGGSWMVAPALLRERRWTDVSRLAREAVTIAAAAPPPAGGPS